METKRDMRVVDVYSDTELQNIIDTADEQGKHYVIIRWGDPPTQELADENIKDENISGKTLDVLKRVVKTRASLIKRILEDNDKR